MVMAARMSDDAVGDSVHGGNMSISIDQSIDRSIDASIIGSWRASVFQEASTKVCCMLDIGKSRAKHRVADLSLSLSLSLPGSDRSEDRVENFL